VDNADTSFLAALYPDIHRHHKTAVRFMSGTAPDILFTPVNRVELRKAIRQRLHREQFQASDADRIFAEMDTDLREGFLVHRPINHTDVYRLADELSAKHPGQRTLDLLHVASAIALKARTRLTFDDPQAALGKAMGLRVKP
jgi:predicted nucleic acid-binding protein